MTIKQLFLTAPLLTACTATEEPDLAEDTLDITGDDASAASQFQLDRAVKIPGCTATKISAHWAITSAHCMPDDNDMVNFYTTGPGISSESARIEEVVLRPGVNATLCFEDIDNCWDSSDKFADIALIRLERTTNELDVEGHQATLAWVYPGTDAFGKKVGAGLHDGNSNSTGVLRQHPDWTQRDNDTDGRFYTVDDHADPGDSGGPFYYGTKVLGTLWGEWWEPFDHYNIYTSVPQHLSWILTTIDYTWRGQPPQTNLLYSGTAIQSFRGTELECQYACEKTSGCEAYNFNTLAFSPAPNCHLQDNIDEVASVSGWRGALKYGERQGNSNDVVGYVRSDGVNTALHRAQNSHLHQLRLDGSQWSVQDIQGDAPLPALGAKLSAYRRSDNSDVVVYRSVDNHIIELRRSSGNTYVHTDLTNLTAMENAVGNPVAYVRADGVSAIVFRGVSGHIREIRRASIGFASRNLTTVAGGEIANSDPSVFVRSDGFNSVLYRSGTEIFELFQSTGGDWASGSPSINANAPDAASRPFGFTKRDGTNMIAYRSTTNALVLLKLVNGQWTFTMPVLQISGDPTAQTRFDGETSIIFRNSTGQLFELTDAGATNITTQANAPLMVNNPAVYHRRDGYNVVLFETSANNVIELYKKGTANWNDGNLTTLSGEDP